MWVRGGVRDAGGSGDLEGAERRVGLCGRDRWTGNSGSRQLGSTEGVWGPGRGGSETVDPREGSPAESGVRVGEGRADGGPSTWRPENRLG